MSKPFNKMKKLIILALWIFSTLACVAGLPVIDVAAITAQRLSAERDYLEQLLHEANQQTAILKMIEQIRQLDTSLERLGDPAAITNLQGLDELMRQLNAAPVLQLPELKAADFQPDEVFRSLDSKLYPKLEKEITLDGKVEATRDDVIYHPEVAERRSQENYQKVKASVLTRREQLRQTMAGTVKAIQSAPTASEVQKLSAVLVGLQAELQSADHELDSAAGEVQTQVSANATEKEILRKAAVERERASMRVSTLKDAEIYKPFTTPIHFGEQP